jgi:hypothetical protein
MKVDFFGNGSRPIQAASRKEFRDRETPRGPPQMAIYREEQIKRQCSCSSKEIIR